MTPPIALTIAGSDSAAGAGAQADLKTFAALGVYGATVITALTAQSTSQVAGIHVSPPDFVDLQISTVLADLHVRAVKTGMLATAEIVGAVAARAAAGDLPSLVVDPVMVASSGARLLDEDAERAYPDLLFPHATVVTPNLREASLLAGRSLESVSDMEDAARRLHDFGSRVVVVKGGHLEGQDAVDVVFDGEQITHLRAPWVDTDNVHGTGCTFAAATAAFLAAGNDVLTALRGAKRYVHAALRGGADWRIGSGHGPLDHFGWSAHLPAPEELGVTYP